MKVAVTRAGAAAVGARGAESDVGGGTGAWGLGPGARVRRAAGGKRSPFEVASRAPPCGPGRRDASRAGDEGQRLGVVLGAGKAGDPARRGSRGSGAPGRARRLGGAPTNVPRILQPGVEVGPCQGRPPLPAHVPFL